MWPPADRDACSCRERDLYWITALIWVWIWSTIQPPSDGDLMLRLAVALPGQHTSKRLAVLGGPNALRVRFDPAFRGAFGH